MFLLSNSLVIDLLPLVEYLFDKNVLPLKHPAGVFVASANANLSGRSPSILLTQDRSIACTPHWGVHC